MDKKYLFPVDGKTEYSIYREYMITAGDYILYIPSSVWNNPGYLKKNSHAIRMNYPQELIEKIEKLLLQKYDDIVHLR